MNRAPRDRPVLTIGHGTKTNDELVHALAAARVALLVDVRRFPGSRRHPHFARERLERSLPDAGIQYEWWGESLGGRRKAAPDSRHPAWRESSFRAYADHMDTEEFRSGLIELEHRAHSLRIAIMCAETLWWKCHRRLIADALTLRGHNVLHVMGPDELQPHRLHPNVRGDEDRWPVYDVGETPRLG